MKCSVFAAIRKRSPTLHGTVSDARDVSTGPCNQMQLPTTPLHMFVSMQTKERLEIHEGSSNTIGPSQLRTTGSGMVSVFADCPL